MPRGSKLQSECAGSQVVKRKKPDIADPPPPTSTIGKEILAKVTAKDNSILVDKDGGYFWTAAALKAVPISDLLNELRPHWESMASVLRDHDLLTVTNNFTNATQKRVRNKGNWLKQDHPTDAATRKKDSEIEKALTAIVEETRGMLRNSKGQIVLPVYPDFCIFALSGFVESLSEILRNDSLTDISCRSELYHRVFELVKTCSSSNDFAELFCTSSEDNGTPIASLLATMNEQANVFLHSKQQVEENADDSEMIISIDISMSIRDSIESISESNHQMKQKIENIEEKYIARLTPHRLRMVSMWDVDTQRYNHAYNKELRSSKKAVGSAAARMKEFSTLTTALPVSWGSGIFIRVDEGRNDCLKALIIGPEGTPYQNGCFMFDIFLPSQYPQVPPKVTLTTTSGGKIRFNPNLYASGKVCLSLLGTWQGPSWIPGKSTLLQVLISIQVCYFLRLSSLPTVIG
eukprot:TRINITY_DN1748_c0_g1_i2.p1 TRINITY_DN1748_c0_g1~~TRINITY_DN1748_c0_g1_i2.p1  ORF type:complete len:462 (+),score=60.44 TRINITY_DN1748_c0_g1_i2:45-1430(+)